MYLGPIRSPQETALTESACDHHFIFDNAFNKKYYILL